jgi:hypothetical protein
VYRCVCVVCHNLVKLSPETSRSDMGSPLRGPMASSSSGNASEPGRQRSIRSRGNSSRRAFEGCIPLWHGLRTSHDLLLVVKKGLCPSHDGNVFHWTNCPGTRSNERLSRQGAGPPSTLPIPM